MKIMFDTNVLITSFLTSGNCYKIVQDAVLKHEVYYTDYIIKELTNVLKLKFDFSQSTIQEITAFIKRYNLKGETCKNISKYCRDKTDDQIIADALHNKIDVIITGDKDLLILKAYANLKIISPKEYWLL